MPSTTPPNPSEVMVIRDITPNITTFSLPFSRFGLIRVGGRATLVRLSSGALSIFSPVTLSPEVKQTIASKGELKYIIAPDMEHHISITSWAQAYPGAHIIGPDGLPQKRSKLSPEDAAVKFDTVISPENKGRVSVSPEFDRDFEVELVDAHPNKELVFWYKPERTLIEADLMFNGVPREQYSRTDKPLDNGWVSWLMNKLQGTDGSAIGQKRLIWYAFSAKDRTGFNNSVRRINTWDFNRIIPCHGDVIENNGKGIFEKVFEWHLKGKDRNQ